MDFSACMTLGNHTFILQRSIQKVDFVAFKRAKALLERGFQDDGIKNQVCSK